MDHDNRIAELDGVRGMAILVVIFFHLHLFGAFSVAPTFGAIVDTGALGVDLFFVLSGFLISSILIDTKEASTFFSSFYIRRVLRIFPLYFLCLAIFFRVYVPCAMRAQLLATTNDAALVLNQFHEVVSQEPWYWLYVSNWCEWLHSGHSIKMLGHFWSLAIEEQFYLVWPLAIYLCRKSRLPLLFTGTIALATVFRVTAELNGAGPETLHRLTIFRLDALACGALAAWICRSSVWMRRATQQLKILAPGSFLLLVLSIYASRTGGTRFPTTSLLYSSAALLFSCLILYCTRYAGSKSLLCRAMRISGLRACGKYSYGMYVFHVPVIVFVMGVASKAHSGFGQVIRSGACLGLTWMLAFESWHLIEKHFLSLKRRFAYGGAIEIPMSKTVDESELLRTEQPFS